MRVAVLVAALACAMATIASRADAGVFEVRSCGASATSAYTPANGSPSTMATATQCPPVAGTLLSGIFAAPLAGTFTPDGLSSGWSVFTPTGLTLRRLDVHRSIGTRRSNWTAVVRTAEGAELESCVLGALVECQRGDPAGDNSATYAGLSTRGVTFSIECHTDPVGLTCPGRTLTQAWVAIYSSVALVDDPTPPTVEPLAGALLTPGWHSENGNLSVGASDASGIKRLSLTAGSTTLYDQAQSCDYSRMQPCPASKREYGGGRHLAASRRDAPTQRRRHRCGGAGRGRDRGPADRPACARGADRARRGAQPGRDAGAGVDESGSGDGGADRGRALRRLRCRRAELRRRGTRARPGHRACSLRGDPRG